jgi:hypothetical protein
MPWRVCKCRWGEGGSYSVQIYILGRNLATRREQPGQAIDRDFLALTAKHESSNDTHNESFVHFSEACCKQRVALFWPFSCRIALSGLLNRGHAFRTLMTNCPIRPLPFSSAFFLWPYDLPPLYDYSSEATYLSEAGAYKEPMLPPLGLKVHILMPPPTTLR